MPRRQNDAAMINLAQQELWQRMWEHSPDQVSRVQRAMADERIREYQARQEAEKVDMRVDTPARSYPGAGGWAVHQAAGSQTRRLSPEQVRGEYELQKTRLKGQIDAGLQETRYTAKDKAAINKLKTQQNEAYRLLQTGEISADDFEKHYKITQNKLMGITPGEFLSTSPYPKGQNVGDTFWQGEGDEKLLVRRVENGDTVPVDMSKTQGWQARQHELDATKEKAKIDAEERKGKQALITKLATEDLVDPVSGKRSRRSPAEIRAMLETVYPSTPAPDPGEVQHAKDFMRMMLGRWGKTPPAEVQASMLEAQALIKAANDRIR